MKVHDLPNAVETLALFYAECSRDRTRDVLPFSGLLDGPDLATFGESLEGLVRAMLIEYTAEKRAQVIEEALGLLGGESPL